MLVDLDLEKLCSNAFDQDRLKAHNIEVAKLCRRVRAGVYTGMIVGAELLLTAAKFKINEDIHFEEIDGISSFGVVDSLDELFEMIPTVLNDKKRKFVIQINEIKKSEQPKTGGWRWHKWGPYYGKQKPTTEYIADEPVIDLVVTYIIIEFFDPNSDYQPKKRNFGELIAWYAKTREAAHVQPRYLRKHNRN